MDQKQMDDLRAEVVSRSREDEPMLQFFTFDHLPTGLQEVSRTFAQVAEMVVQNLPRNPERSACLRKLLEAKDCAVRARIYRP